MRRFGLSEREQERVWELWGDGTSLRAVARKLGARPEYVRRYVTSTGGVKPAPRKRAERCLSKREREEISRGLARGESCHAIAAAIGRTHTTVSREVSRNGGRERYRAHDAEEAAWGRARRPKRSKLAVSSRLREVVEERLELDWSPEQISAWLGRTCRTRRSICRCSFSRVGRCGTSSVLTCDALGGRAGRGGGRRRRAAASSGRW